MILLEKTQKRQQQIAAAVGGGIYLFTRLTAKNTSLIRKGVFTLHQYQMRVSGGGGGGGGGGGFFYRVAAKETSNLVGCRIIQKTI